MLSKELKVYCIYYIPPLSKHTEYRPVTDSNNTGTRVR